MAEGDLTKSDGDILYASEINNMVRKNYASGILPTASGFTVDPTNLANFTDGDFSSVTGTGTETASSADDIYVTVDLGQIISCSKVFYKIGLWVDVNGGGTSTADIEVSEDGAAWTSIGDIDTDITNTTETVHTGYFNIPSSNFRVRYVRAHVLANVNDNDFNFKGYELQIQ